MRARFEKVGGEERVLYAFERSETSFPFYWHYHPEFELTLILEGSGQRLVGDSIEEYGPGDLVLLGPNLPHTYRSGLVGGPNRAFVLQFRLELLGNIFFSLPEMRSLRRFLDRATQGFAFSFANESKKALLHAQILTLPTRSTSAQILVLLEILDTLASTATAHALSRTHVLPPVKAEDQKRINTICHFLCEHYDQEIDYARLTKKLHMSQASICRFFHRATGRTMTEYVNNYRISVAAHLLKETDKSILEIAFEVGFGNYSHFNRQFQRRKGKTPRLFRATFGNTAVQLN
ncbi:AraC family transcriptional regulator [Tunturiibacter empetritectus]|uniref:AraC-like DNA-binding protein n=2 Tax=Tunturiibacter TaxID=3154218 RepID=A0A852VHI5_9BACT|nr:AraC family transcriptional regulator [Edaphobacter lichenicola]NYF92253.1 AraC-like DNA-binding protein [Edaphobacter lichenicola]